jgi:hypothetical protein
MKIVGLIDEDIVNYKKCSMYIAFPNCSFKCGQDLCQNSELAKSPKYEISFEEVCERYLQNPLTSAIVLAGLEPFDSPFDLIGIVDTLRHKYTCNDDIVIYTGYTEQEFLVPSDLRLGIVHQNLCKYKKLIVKYGRYLPNEEPHFDEVLGVNLASSNQYAKRIGKNDN